MDILKTIQDTINPAVDNGIVSFGAVLAMKDGKEAIRYSYGYQDIENKIPYTDKTILRAFSCSKTFTSLAVFKCLEMGLLKLDEPISKYFPSFKNPKVIKDGKEFPAKREIIIKDLLDMRAGLSYPEYGTPTGEYAIKVNEQLGQDKLTTLEFAEKLGAGPLLFNPGEDYKYSFCADVLGALVEKVSGISFRDFCIKYIFNPLGLNDTDFFVSEDKKKHIAKGYLTKDNKLVYIDFPTIGIKATGEKTPFESGGAGLFMTLDNLSRYAECLLNETEGILSKETFNKMVDQKYSSNPPIINNGYTYFNLMRHMTRPSECQEECTLGEYGWDGALGTFIMIDPTNKITLVMGFQSFDDKKWEYVWKLKGEIFKYLKNK